MGLSSSPRSHSTHSTVPAASLHQGMPGGRCGRNRETPWGAWTEASRSPKGSPRSIGRGRHPPTTPGRPAPSESALSVCPHRWIATPCWTWHLHLFPTDGAAYRSGIPRRSPCLSLSEDCTLSAQQLLRSTDILLLAALRVRVTKVRDLPMSRSDKTLESLSLFKLPLTPTPHNHYHL